MHAEPVTHTRTHTRLGHSRTYMLLVIAMLFYGMSFISTKIVLEVLGPVAILLIRITISAIILSLIDRRRGDEAKVSRGDLKWFALVALFQPVLYFLAENFGLQRVSASAASIVIGTIPVVTPVIAAPILRERLSPLNIAGLFISLAGVTLIVLEGRARPDVEPTGIALLFVAVVAAAAYAVAVRAVPRRYSALTIVRMQNVLGVLMVLPVFLLLEAPPLFAAPAAATLTAVPWFSGFGALVVTTIAENRSAVGHLLFLAVFPSTLSFLFLSSGIRAVGAARANAFANLVPMFTALFSFLLLDERVTLMTLSGMAVVIAGVSLAQVRGARVASA